MSWIIGEYLKELPYLKENPDINSDIYNNALIIEMTIKDMDKKGLLTDFEKDVIMGIYSGYNFSEIARLLSADRQRVSNTYKEVTDRIAFILGGEFTDAAFMEQAKGIEEISEQDVSEIFKRGLIKVDE